MLLKITISEREFLEKVSKSKEKAFFLTKKNDILQLKNDVSIEEYERIVRRILYSLIREKKFILKKFSFLRKERLFVCNVINEFEEKVNLLDMRLRDFLIYIEEYEETTIEVMSFLKKTENKIGEEVLVKDAFFKFFYLLPYKKKSVEDEILRIFEKNNIILSEKEKELIKFKTKTISV